MPGPQLSDHQVIFDKLGTFFFELANVSHPQNNSSRTLEDVILGCGKLFTSGLGERLRSIEGSFSPSFSGRRSLRIDEKRAVARWCLLRALQTLSGAKTTPRIFLEGSSTVLHLAEMIADLVPLELAPDELGDFQTMILSMLNVVTNSLYIDFLLHRSTHRIERLGGGMEREDDGCSYAFQSTSLPAKYYPLAQVEADQYNIVALSAQQSHVVVMGARQLSLTLGPLTNSRDSALFKRAQFGGFKRTSNGDQLAGIETVDSELYILIDESKILWAPPPGPPPVNTAGAGKSSKCLVFGRPGSASAANEKNTYKNISSPIEDALNKWKEMKTLRFTPDGLASTWVAWLDECPDGLLGRIKIAIGYSTDKVDFKKQIDSEIGSANKSYKSVSKSKLQVKILEGEGDDNQVIVIGFHRS